MTREHAYKLRKLIEQSATTLNDADALEGIELFPLWKDDAEYLVGDRIRYEDILYKCVQAHASQPSWTPDITPALWVRVSIDEFPEWIQPTGVQDAYMTGDKVSHNDKHWVSLIDGNVWEPGAIGSEALWSEIE